LLVCAKCITLHANVNLLEIVKYDFFIKILFFVPIVGENYGNFLEKYTMVGRFLSFYG